MFKGFPGSKKLQGFLGTSGDPGNVAQQSKEMWASFKPVGPDICDIP